MQTQAELIDPTAVPLEAIPSLIEQTIGFFVIERQVLQTTGDFRSERDVEELWDAVVVRLTTALENALRDDVDPENYMDVKESLLAFTTTLEVSATLWYRAFGADLSSVLCIHNNTIA